MLETGKLICKHVFLKQNQLQGKLAQVEMSKLSSDLESLEGQVDQAQNLNSSMEKRQNSLIAL